MDPKAALMQALDFFISGDTPTAAERLYNYQEWRRKGGYEPDVSDALDPDEYIPMGVSEEMRKHTCCADHVAQWLFIEIKQDIAKHAGLAIDKLDPHTLDVIEELMGGA